MSEPPSAQYDSEGFWGHLEERYGDQGAVYLANEHTVRLSWNSAAMDFDPDISCRVRIAVLDHERAASLRHWVIPEPYAVKSDRLHVRVYDSRDSSYHELGLTDITREKVAGDFYNHKFSIPDFRSGIIIEIERDTFAGRDWTPACLIPIVRE